MYTVKYVSYFKRCIVYVMWGVRKYIMNNKAFHFFDGTFFKLNFDKLCYRFYIFYLTPVRYESYNYVNNYNFHSFCLFYCAQNSICTVFVCSIAHKVFFITNWMTIGTVGVFYIYPMYESGITTF